MVTTPRVCYQREIMSELDVTFRHVERDQYKRRDFGSSDGLSRRLAAVHCGTQHAFRR